MNRPIVKYVVRIALFASAIAAVACTSPTAPSNVQSKKPSLKDTIEGDSTLCRSGWTIGQGRYICNAEG